MTTFSAIGEVLWDRFERSRYLGGSPFNFTACARNLGADTYLISRVGNDPEGTEILDQMEKRALPVDFIQIDSCRPTGETLIQLQGKGIPAFDCLEDRAYDYIAFEASEFRQLYCDSDLFYVGTLAQRAPVSRRTIQRFLQGTSGRITIAYDMNLRGWSAETGATVAETLKQADLLKVNADELRQLFTQLFPRQLKWDLPEQLAYLHETCGLELIALTLGAHGAVLSTRDQAPVYSPAFKIHALDTTGAGDAFCAALCLGWLQQMPLEDLGQLANAAGGFVATRNGATPDFTWDQLQVFILNHDKDDSWL